MANTQAQRMFGYNERELLGLPVEILLPSPCAGATSSIASATQSPSTRPMGIGFGLAGRRHDGSEVPVEISLSPVSTPDRVLVISVIRDMTERRRVEEEIRTLNDTLARRVAELTR